MSSQYMSKPLKDINKEKDNRRLFTAFAVVCVLVMCIYAIYFNTLGPDAAAVMNFFGIDNGQHGFIMTVQSIGSLIVAIYLTIYGERFNKIHSGLLGAVFIAASALLIGSIPAYTEQGTGYPLILSFVAVGGIGMSLVDVNINGIITDVYSERKNTLLPLMHAFYGAACMLIPVLVSVTTDDKVPESFGNPYIIVGLIGCGAFISFAVLGRRMKPFTPYNDMTDMIKRTKENPFEIYKSPLAWILIAAAYLYFFFQIGIVNWFPTFSIRDLGIDYKFAALFNTAFFGGQLVMRFLLALLLRKMKAETCFVLFGLIGAVCVFLSMLMPNAYGVMAMLIIGGFFQGGNATLLVLISTNVFPKRSAAAAAIVAIAVGLASLTGPLIIGMIADANSRSLKISILLMVVCLVVSAVIMALFARKKRSISEG